MIKLQNFATAFLKRDGKYLLMKRSAEKKIAPNVWCSVGGHIEEYEMNEPEAACMREIEEETGIKGAQVQNLKLRYVIMRRARDILRQNYVYFGETTAKDLINTDEGTLHWIPEKELLNREFTQTFTAMLRHYTETPDCENIVIGAAHSVDGKLKMSWSSIRDFD